MGERSKIEWCNHTFNPWWGCEKVSPACKHCYAESWAKRCGQRLWGSGSQRRFFGEKHWAGPLKWNRAAEQTGVRRRVFCASMADVFEDRPELEPWREKLWALIETTPWLDWLLLTKRPENAAGMVPWNGSWPSHVWAGATAENQEQLEKRLGELTRLPASIRFLSCEPLLERIQLPMSKDLINWVIVGGESGHGARAFDVTWARDLIRQCRSAGAACFVKQLGTRPTHGTELLSLRDRKGGDWNDWPRELRVREFPTLNQLGGK